MICKDCCEKLWDFDELSESEKEEIIVHLAECEECRKEYALIKSVQENPAPVAISVADRVVKTLEKERVRRRPLKLVKYSAAACLVLVLCLSLYFNMFDKFAAETEDCADFELSLKAETAFDGAVGTTDNGAKNEFFDYAEPESIFEEEKPAQEDVSALEPEAPEPPKASMGVLDEAPEADEQMKLNLYKEMHTLSSHSSDIVVEGGDIDSALEVLAHLDAVLTDDHLELEGDVTVDTVKALSQNGFEVIYTTSSETVFKTLVFFNGLFE